VIATGLPASTVHAILARHGLRRLAWLERLADRACWRSLARRRSMNCPMCAAIPDSSATRAIPVLVVVGRRAAVVLMAVGLDTARRSR
jgi:hypothetical protein